MPNVVTVILGILGLLALAAGVTSVVARRRMSSNMIQAGILRGSNANAALYVILLGVLQIVVGVMLMGLAVVLPERIGEF